MVNIIVAFPKIENAKNIKSVLMKGGYSVTAVCTSGGQALQYANELSEGILMCGSRLSDMAYQQLYQDMPGHFQMLLVASPATCEQKVAEDIISISMPFKVHELLHTVEMMEYVIARRKKKRKEIPKKRSREEQDWIDRAKALLMDRNHMTEEEAHRYIQKTSMDNGTSFTETAQMVLSIMNS